MPVAFRKGTFRWQLAANREVPGLRDAGRFPVGSPSKKPRHSLGLFAWLTSEQANCLACVGNRTAGALSEFACLGQGEDGEAGPRAFSVRKMTCWSTSPWGHHKNLRFVLGFLFASVFRLYCR